MCISYAHCFWSRKSCYHIVGTPPKIVLILKQNNFAFNKFGINFTNLTKVSELRYAFLYFFRQPVFTLAWKHEEWDNLAIFNPLWSSPTPKQTNESATANEKAWCTLYNSTDTNLQITFFPREKTKNFISGTKEKRLLQRLLIRLLLSKEGGKASFSLAIQKILSPPTGSIFTTASVVSVPPLDMKYALPRWSPLSFM